MSDRFRTVVINDASDDALETYHEDLKRRGITVTLDMDPLDLL